MLDFGGRRLHYSFCIRIELDPLLLQCFYIGVVVSHCEVNIGKFKLVGSRDFVCALPLEFYPVYNIPHSYPGAINSRLTPADIVGLDNSIC